MDKSEWKQDWNAGSRLIQTSIPIKTGDSWEVSCKLPKYKMWETKKTQNCEVIVINLKFYNQYWKQLIIIDFVVTH